VKRVIFAIIVLVTVEFLITTESVLAAGVGGPIRHLEPGEWVTGVGYDSLFDMDLSGASDAEVDRYNALYIKSAMHSFDIVTFYAKLGMADLEYHGRIDSADITADYNFGIYGGLGFKLDWEFQKSWWAGTDLQYAMWRSELDSLTRDSATASSITGDAQTGELQWAFYAMKVYKLKDMGKANLYLGGKLTDLKIEQSGARYMIGTAEYTLDEDLKEDDNFFSIFGGVDIEFLSPSIIAHIEGACIGETSFSTSIVYKF